MKLTRRHIRRSLLGLLLGIVSFATVRVLLLRRITSPVHLSARAASGPFNHRVAFELQTRARPKVSSITCLIAKDLHFLPGWVDNVKGELCPFSTELLVAVYDDDTLRAAASLLQHVTCALKLVRFTTDPGLYASWDMLIGHYASAPLLTTLAVDDRRAGASLAGALQVFERDPAAAVLSFATDFINEQGRDFMGTWWSARAVPHLSQLHLADLVKTDRAGKVVGAENIPHCAPVWRRSLHSTHGFFDSEVFGAASDYAFWIRAALGGAKFVHWSLPPSGVVFFLRESSHNNRRLHRPRRRGEKSSEEIIFDTYGLHRMGLYNNLHFNAQGNTSRPQRRLAIITETLPLDAHDTYSSRLTQLATFLARNGHFVTVFARGNETQHFAATFDGLHGIETAVDVDMSIAYTMQRVCDGDYDVAFVFLWFWRHNWERTVDTQAETLLRRECGARRKPEVAVFSEDVHYARCQYIGVSSGACEGIGERERFVYKTASVVFAATSEHEAVFRTLGAGRTAVLPPGGTTHWVKQPLFMQLLLSPNGS